jgi:dihydroorotate dehydrogenase
MDALLRAALFQLESEQSHHAALAMLSTLGAMPGGLAALRGLYAPRRQRPVTLAGLTFANPVGLAAGYDKNATAWRGLAALGFGHVEVGTVTPRPQPGNPKPRVFRLTEDRCLINRLGFPSEGADAVHPRLKGRGGCILGVNLGRNKSTPNEEAARDYVLLARQFADVADYLTVNVSSPNTPGLRALQTGDALRALLSEVVQVRDEVRGGKPLPVFVKLSPDLEDADLDDALKAVSDARIDGVIATNTTLSREGLQSPLRDEKGGMSGARLTERSEAVIRRIRELAGDDLPLIGVGGIMTPEHVRRRLDAGADLVQVYTGMVYGGPGLVRRMVEAVA